MQYYNNPDLQALINREWLVTNGIGGYASSTIFGVNTRRYHGLLVAAQKPPGDRMVFVSKIEESVEGKAGQVAFSTNKYPGVTYPEGYRYLSSFDRSSFPKAVFQAGPYKIDKTIFMVYGSNTTVVSYRNTGEISFQLSLNPLFVYRDYHALFQANDYFDFFHNQIEERQLELFAHYGAIPLYISFSRGDFHSNEAWFYQFQYEREEARGLDFQEDAKSIGQIKVLLDPGQEVHLIFSTEKEKLSEDPEKLRSQEQIRIDALDIGKEPVLNDFAISGDQFLVWRASSNSYSLIAGYHWFMDWGRDAMIAMRGLTIALGKANASRSILRTFLQYLDQGMLPNRFPDQGELPEYNTIDATLWLFVVLYEYYEKFEDLSFVEEVFPQLEEILEAHFNGTRFQIHVTAEGLLYGGEGIAQLTWMDARVGDYVVTPRHGCPVEVNALWYNALCIYEALGKELGKDVGTYKTATNKCREAFRSYFFNEQGYLNDVVVPGQPADESIRPNQIYAVSLPFSPLTAEEAGSVLSVVEEKLYTDVGLRSLAMDHPDFKPIYQGGVWQRDTAYHQGTVWAFLWGEWALAYLKVHQYSEVAKYHVRTQSAVLRHHFYEEDCLNGISEVFDGANPSMGKGCVQQAWSIGMLIKVWTMLS